MRRQADDQTPEPTSGQRSNRSGEAPRIVVVTPAYNEEESLARVGASMLVQSLKPNLWMIVDDGSSDKTARIANRLAEGQNWISVLRKERELGKVVTTLSKGDVLIVSELSRLGRSMLEIMTLLCQLAEKGVRVYAIKGNHKVEDSIQSRIMTMVLCMAAEIEKELISQRTKEALQRKKQEGMTLGRPKGVPGKSKLDGKEEDIKNLLDKNVGIASLAKIYDCSWPTMKNFIEKKVLKGGQRNR